MKRKKNEEKVDWFSSSLAYLILIILPAALYFQTIFFDFTSFDDRILIIDNYHQINKLVYIFDAFSRDVFSNLDGIFYRPLLTITFIIDAAIGGKEPMMYHVTNLILHILCVLLLFQLLKRLNISSKKSFFFSLIFAVHPVLVQAVAWIPGRNDTLLTLFILLSINFYVKYLAAEKISQKYLSIFFLAIFYLCSLLTKETAIIFPFILGFHFFVIEREKSRIDLLFLLAAVVIPVVFWFIMRSSVIEGETDLLGILFKYNIERLHGIALYISKVFLPINLSPFPTYKDTAIIFALPVLIIFAISLFIFRIKNLRMFIWGILWFLLFLLPSLSFAEGNIVFLEHRLYLPMIGIVISLLQLSLKENRNLNVKIKYSFLIGVILIFSATAFSHSKVFSSSRVMWETAEQKSPSSPFVHNNLGNVYMREGEIRNAVTQYEKAVSLNPDHAEAHLNLGYAFRKEGAVDQAELYYKKAIELRPNYSKAFNNLGNLYLSKNMYAKAEESFLSAVESDPDYYEAYSNLGSLYYKQGNAELAKINWEKSIKINPEFAQAYYNLGVLFYNSKEYKKAGQYFGRAQELGLNVNPALLNSVKEKLK